MFKTKLVGTVGSARLNTVNDTTEALNVRLVRNNSYKDKNTGERVEHDNWVTLTYFRPKGSFANLIDTVFRTGNVIEADVEIRERKVKDSDHNELVLIGRTVDVVRWKALAEGTQAGSGDKPAGNAQDQNGAPDNTPRNVDDFDDDIPF